MADVQGKSINITQLENMFSNIAENTEWNMSGNMLWGYFFTHHEPQKLEKAKDVLIAQGYKFVKIYASDSKNKNEPDMYWLHIEKVETHTTASLDQRNNEFYVFAHEFGIDSYDGMDVGPMGK